MQTLRSGAEGDGPTIAHYLRASGLPALEARVLMAHVLRVDRAWLAAHDDVALSGEPYSRVEALFRRRRAGEPVAYLIGEREFRGLSIAVTPAVLIPRPETELLVELALERLRNGQRVIDLGTGSGAVAISLALGRPDIGVAAAEISREALDLARANAARHGARVHFEQSDWFSAFHAERFDMVVANPPYIAAQDPHLAQGDLRFEPRGALEAGVQGLECIAAIAAAVTRHLSPGGWLLMEHGHDQGQACVRLAQSLGYVGVQDYPDLAGIPRVLVARG